MLLTPDWSAQERVRLQGGSSDRDVTQCECVFKCEDVSLEAERIQIQTCKVTHEVCPERLNVFTH